MAIRKSVSALSSEEKNTLVAAILKLKSDGSYDRFVKLHAEGARHGIHKSPDFLPWHRKFIAELEDKIQQVSGNRELGLPYWNWAEDATRPDPKSAPIWADDLLGGNGDENEKWAVQTGPFRAGKWTTLNGGPLTRKMGQEVPTLPTQADIDAAMATTPYDADPWNDESQPSFRNRLEGWYGASGPGLHNRCHVWVGGAMEDTMRSPDDPAFFFHHCFVDKIWADWQDENPDLPYLDDPERTNPKMAPTFTGSYTPSEVLDHRALGYSYVPIGRKVRAWGDNEYGQTTVPPIAQGGVIAIAAGTWHTVALKSDGKVLAWGANDESQDEGQTTVPRKAQSGVIAIAASGWHTVALKNDGTVLAWGNNDDGQTNVPDDLSGVNAIAAGGKHTVALKSDGKVLAWGANDEGQTNVPDDLSGVIKIAAGAGHTVALKRDGTVVAWGWNDSGQTTVPRKAQSGVIAIAASGWHTVALKSDGKVVAWGYNDSGQTNVPDDLSGVNAIAAGGAHTVALKSDGKVVAWGLNRDGQTNVPDDLSGVIKIAAGDYHTVALYN